MTGLVDGSPADAAGLLVGDIIVGFDGEPVQEPEQLVMRLRGDRVGKRRGADGLLRAGAAHDVAGDRRRAALDDGRAGKLGSTWPIPFASSSRGSDADERAELAGARASDAALGDWSATRRAADVVVVLSPRRGRGCQRQHAGRSAHVTADPTCRER